MRLALCNIGIILSTLVGAVIMTIVMAAWPIWSLVRSIIFVIKNRDLIDHGAIGINLWAAYAAVLAGMGKGLYNVAQEEVDKYEKEFEEEA